MENEKRPVATAQQNRPMRGIIFGLMGLIIFAGSVGLVYFWQYQEVNSLHAQVADLDTAVNDQKAQVADREKALSALPNKVEDLAHSPLDLIAFLAADNTQCYKSQSSGYYKIITQANNQFAKMQYGCVASNATIPSGTATHILAKKVNGKWQLVSPTDQWIAIQENQDIPSCTMVNDNKISKIVTPQCFVGSIGSPTVQQVTNP